MNEKDMLKEFSLEIVSGNLVVCDPCYDLNTNCCAITKAVNGTWRVSVSYVISMGKRVQSFTARHSSYGPKDIARSKTFKLPVDSGQLGIFDVSIYKNDNSIANCERLYKEELICEDEPWYSICCDRTLSENSCGEIPNGFVSSSGLGDGCYECEVFYNKEGLAFWLSVEFIPESENEEYDEQYVVEEYDYEEDAG